MSGEEEPATAASAGSGDDLSFGSWIASAYPDGGPFRGGYTWDDMESAFEAGRRNAGARTAA